MAIKNLSTLKDRHKGERGFIVGNGPSIRETDLDLLSDEISFGLNSCGRFFGWTAWRPTYWVADTTVTMDDHHLPYARIANESAETSFLFQDAPAEFEGYRLNFLQAEIMDLRSENGLPQADWWSDDPAESVSRYGTISFACLQIAAWLGLNPLYLVGMDLGFQPHNELGRDPNHADPNYNLPQPEMNWDGVHLSHRGAHSLALANAERLGVEILNATEGGELEIYPRVQYGSLFNGRMSQ